MAYQVLTAAGTAAPRGAAGPQGWKRPGKGDGGENSQGPETRQLGDQAEGGRPQTQDPAGSATKQTHLCQAACRF